MNCSQKNGGNGKRHLVFITIITVIMIGVYNYWFSSDVRSKNYCREGYELTVQGKTEEAIAAYSKAIELNPKNEQAYAGRVMLESGEAQLADCNKLIEFQPQIARWYAMRAKYYVETKKYDEATSDCKKALELAPGDSHSLLARAAIYRAQGKYSDALADCNQALEAEPTYAAAFELRGLIYKEEKEYSKAVSDLSKAIEFAEDKDKETYTRERHEIYEAMIPKSDNQTDIAHMSGNVLVENGDSCYNAGKYSEAVTYYTEALGIRGGSSLYLKRGNAYQHLGDYVLAIADYTKVIEDNKHKTTQNQSLSSSKNSLAHAYFGRGNCYAEQGNLERAIDDYTQAIENNPKESSAYTNRGICYDQQGDYGQALGNYTKAIELNPKNITAYRNRGNIYQRLGNMAEAEADFAKARELEEKK